MKQKGPKTKDKLRLLVQVDDAVVREHCVTYYKYGKMKYRLETMYKTSQRYKELSTSDDLDSEDQEKYKELYDQTREKIPGILDKLEPFETELGLASAKKIESPPLQKSPSKKGAAPAKVKEPSMKEKVEKYTGPLDQNKKTIFKWALDQSQLKIIHEHAITMTEEKK